MPTPRLSDPYFDIDAGSYDAEKDLKEKQAFMGMTVGMYDKGKGIRTANEVQDIFADADMTTPEGVTSAISRLYKVEGVGPKIAQELRDFALQQKKAQIDLKNAETAFQNMLALKEYRESAIQESKHKIALNKAENRYLGSGWGNSINRWASETVVPGSGDNWLGFGGVTQEDINSVSNLKQFRKLLKDADFKTSDIDDAVKDLKKAHQRYAKEFAVNQLDYLDKAGDGPAKDDSGENDIRKIINGDGSKRDAPETEEHKAGRRKRTRDVLAGLPGFPPNIFDNLIKATDPENNVTIESVFKNITGYGSPAGEGVSFRKMPHYGLTQKGMLEGVESGPKPNQRERDIYSKLENAPLPQANTTGSSQIGRIREALNRLGRQQSEYSGYSIPYPKLLSQEEGMLRGVESRPLPDQVGREAYATQGVPPVGNRTASPGGSRMLSETGEALNFGKEDTRSMPVEEFRELAEDISKGWEKLSRQDQMQTIQFATQYAESNPDISAEQLASKFKIPLAFAQEIIRTITGIRNRKNTFLTNR